MRIKRSVLDCMDYYTGGHGKVLKMERQEYLTNLSQYEGLSLREIERLSGHSFRTVKKYVDREGELGVQTPERAGIAAGTAESGNRRVAERRFKEEPEVPPDGNEDIQRLGE